ncbi:MAG: HAD family hydrolase [Bacilli bacterium]
MLKSVFFDLDGTLLPMDEKKFTDFYFEMLFQKVKSHGYQKDTLIETIWKGTYLMYKNNGEETNEEVFWHYFKSIYGEKGLADKALFDDFYQHEFAKAKEVCGDNPLAKEIVSFAKKLTGGAVLSTNPIFPKVGTKTRMGFVSLEESDFDYVTTYENCSYSKPNPLYFTSILQHLSLQPEEVILFGNNDYEDYACAKTAGIDCYLTGNLILHPDKDIQCPIIKMDEIMSVIEKEYEKRK